MTELEEQVRAITKEAGGSQGVSSEQIAQAKRTFLEWEERFEREFAGASRPLSGAPVRLGVAAAVLVCLFGIGVWTYSRHFGNQPDTRNQPAIEVLRGAKQFERTLTQNALPVHQTFRVELVRIKDVETKESGSLEVWSESGSGRYATRWTDSRGSLKYARWRTQTGQQYAYDSRVATDVIPMAESESSGVSLVELYQDDLDMEGLQTHFIQWLQQRHWHPVTFADDLGTFASQDGVTLKLERTDLRRGGAAVRVVTRRAQAGFDIEWIFEADAVTYRPRLQEIRLHAPDQTVVVRMIAEQARIVPANLVQPAVFEPAIRKGEPQASKSASTAGRQLQRHLEPAEPPLPRAPVRPAPGDAEIKVRYALHEARACLGEAVEISRDASGHLQIHGLVETQERKATLLALLAQRAPSFATINIQTVEDISSGRATGIGSDAYELRLASRGIPIQKQLERYVALRQSIIRQLQKEAPGESPNIPQLVVELSNEAVSLSLSSLEEAWALRRLAERYAADEINTLSSQGQFLLGVMLRDHLAAVTRQSSDLQKLLEPVLISITDENFMPDGFADARGSTGAPGGTSGIDASWGAASLAVFEAVRQIDRSVHVLFAGAQLLGAIESAHLDQGQLSPAEPYQELIRSLLKEFPAIDSTIWGLDLRLAHQFPDSSALERVAARSQ